MSSHPINRVSGLAPIMMSLLALLAVAKAVVNFKRFGPPGDEDGPWDVFVLMMLVQPPIILYFLYCSRHEFRRMLPVLATQVSLWVISLGAAYGLPGLH